MKKLISIMVVSMICGLVLSSPVLCRERIGKAVRMEVREDQASISTGLVIKTIGQDDRNAIRRDESGWHGIDPVAQPGERDQSISKEYPPSTNDPGAGFPGYWFVILSALRAIFGRP